MSWRIVKSPEDYPDLKARMERDLARSRCCSEKKAVIERYKTLARRRGELETPKPKPSLKKK